MAIALDAATPAFSTTVGGTNMSAQNTGTVQWSFTSGSFSPPANTLVAIPVILSMGGAVSPTGLGMSITESHGNTMVLGNSQPATLCYGATAIWYFYYATAPGATTVTVTVTANVQTLANACVDLYPLLLDGCASVQTGAGKGQANYPSAGASANQTCSVITTQAGSRVLVVNCNGANTVGTPVASTTNLQQVASDPSVNNANWGWTAATGTPGATTVGWTQGAAQIGSVCALEILPASGGPAAPPPPPVLAVPPGRLSPMTVPSWAQTVSQPTPLAAGTYGIIQRGELTGATGGALRQPTVAGTTLIVTTISNTATVPVITLTGSVTAPMTCGFWTAGHNAVFTGVYYILNNPGGITGFTTAGVNACYYREVAGIPPNPMIYWNSAGNAAAVSAFTEPLPGLVSAGDFSTAIVAYNFSNAGVAYADGWTDLQWMYNYSQTSYTTGTVSGSGTLTTTAAFDSAVLTFKQVNQTGPWSAIGSLTSQGVTAGQGSFTIPVTTPGSLLVVYTKTGIGTNYVTGISGAGTTWTQALPNFTDTNAAPHVQNAWIARAAPGFTGSQVLTITYSAAIGSTAVEHAFQEFYPGQPALYSVSSAPAGQNNASNNFPTWPVMGATLTSQGELFVGYARIPSGATPYRTPTAPAVIQTGPNGSAFLYALNLVGGSWQPQAWSTAASLSYCSGINVAFTPAVTPPAFGDSGTLQPVFPPPSIRADAIITPPALAVSAAFSNPVSVGQPTIGVQPRCTLSGAVNATAVSVPLTGWANAGAGVPGTAPAAGDFVVMILTSVTASDTVAQTAGTPWASFDGGINNNGGTVGLTTSAWYKIWEGTETAPTWTWGTGNRISYAVMALTPDPGYMIFPDPLVGWKKDTAAATAHTPGTALVGTGYTDLSLILSGAAASATGTTPFSYTPSAGYTIPPGASASNVGTSAQFVYGSSIEYAAGQASGTTVTPGAETIQGGSGAAGTTQATMYHLLLRELQISSYPFRIVQTAIAPAATSAVFANPTSPGSGIVVILPLTNAGSTTVFPSVSAVTLGGAAGNFTAVRQQTVAGAGNTYYAGIWADPDCAAGQTVVAFTAANNSGGAATGVIAMEVTGLGIAPAIGSSVDKTAGASGTSANPNSGATAATAQASELVVGAWSGGFGLGAVAGPSPAGGNVGLYTSNALAGGTYAFATATGAFTYSGTQKGSYGWACIIATFISGATAHPATLAGSASFPAPAVFQPKMATLTDTFPGTSLNASLWGSFGAPVVNNGLSLTTTASSTNYLGISSNARYDLTGSYLLAQLTSAGTQYTSTQTMIAIQLDGSNSAELMVMNGNLIAQTEVAGSYVQQGTLAYNSATMKWLRIRESGGTMYFEYSADTVSWTTLVSVANPWAVTSLVATIQAGAYAATDPASTSAWANVNVVSVPATVTPAVLAVSTAFPALTITAGSGATVTLAALATSASFLGPGIVAGEAVSPASLHVTASFPAPTVSTGSGITPAVLAVSASFPAPSIGTSASATVTPPALAAGSSFPAMTITAQSSATVTPVSLAVPVSFPAPALHAGETVTAAVLAVSTSFAVPSIRADAAVTPPVLAVAAGFAAVTPNAGSGVTPAALAAVTGFAAPAVDPVPVAVLAVSTSFAAPAVDSITPAPLAASAVFPAVAISAGSGASITPAVLAVPAGFGAPAIRADQIAAPGTLAGQAAFPAPVLHTGETVTAPLLAATAVFPAPVVSAGSVVAPPALAVTAVFPAPVVGTGSVVTPSVLAVSTSFPAPVVSAGSVITPPSLAVAAGFPARVVDAGSAVTPPVLATTAVFPALAADSVQPPALAASAAFPPPLIPAQAPLLAASASFPAQAVNAGASVTPDALAVAAGFSTPGVSAGGNATAVPPALAASASFPAPAVGTGETAPVPVLAVSAAFSAPGVGAGSGVIPAALATGAAFSTPALHCGATVIPSVLAAPASFPAPSIGTASNATVTPAALSATAAFPPLAVNASESVTPALLACAASFPVVTISAGVSAVPPALFCTASFPAPSIGTASNATVTPAALAGSASFPLPAVNAGEGVTPARLACAASFPAPAITVSASVTVTPVTLAVTAAPFHVPAISTSAGINIVTVHQDSEASFPAPVILAGQGSVVTPPVLAVLPAFPAPAVSAGERVTVTALPGAASFPAVTVSAGAIAVPPALSGAVSFPAPSIQAGTAVFVVPTALGGSVFFPAPQLHCGAVASLAGLTVTAVFPAPGLSTGQQAVPPALAGLASFPLSAIAPVVLAPMAMTASGSMRIYAASGPDLDTLWREYQALAAVAQADANLWVEARIAGAGSGMTGSYYSDLWESDGAAQRAWHAWAEASEDWNRQLHQFAQYGEEPQDPVYGGVS